MASAVEIKVLGVVMTSSPAFPHAQPEQCQMQSAGPGIDRHAVFHLAVGGEFPLELLNFLAQDKGSLAASTVERRQNLLAQRGVLGFQISIGNDHGYPLRRGARIHRF